MKNIILWNYERASWQWDLMCFVIVLFIFLTPKIWFEKRDRATIQPARVIVQAKDFSPDKAVLRNRVREIIGSGDAEIVNTQEKKNEQGETFYIIDVR